MHMPVFSPRPVMKLKPTEEETLATPGTLRMRVSIWRRASSVRDMVASGAIWTMQKMVPLSSEGRKEEGVWTKREYPAQRIPPKSSSVSHARRTSAFEPTM